MSMLMSMSMSIDVDVDVVDGNGISRATKNDKGYNVGGSRPSLPRATVVDNNVAMHRHDRCTHHRARSSPPLRPQFGSAGRWRGWRARRPCVCGRLHNPLQRSRQEEWGGRGVIGDPLDEHTTIKLRRRLPTRRGNRRTDEISRGAGDGKQ